jgi:glycosyltransferase involved in cell wall biosynthesis
MRLCLFSQEDIVKPQGGIGTYVRNISIALAACGHDVHVISRHRDGDALCEDVDGVKLHRVRAPGPPVLYSPLYFRAARQMFHQLSAAGPFDALHGNLPLMSTWGVKKEQLPPIIETVHCTVREELRALSHTTLNQLNFNEVLTRALTPVLYHREGQLLHRARRVITVSRGLKRELVEQEGFDAERVEVIPNGIDVRHFAAGHTEAQALRRTLGIDPGERVVLYLGRLVERKRAIDLVRALALVRREVPDVHLVVVGGHTANAARLEAEARSLALAERVHLVSHVPYRNVPSYYAMADVYALPSAYEGFPFTIIEAMAAGTPVVASDIPGIDEQVISGETGLLHPVGDIAMIAAQITKILREPVLAQRFAAAAQRNVRANYTWDLIGKQTERVFTEAVAETVA